MSILFLWNENGDWRQTAKALYCCVFNANLLCLLYFYFCPAQTILDNPTNFQNPFQFEITFECLQELDDGASPRIL